VRPKFSVIIPTRSRSSTLRYTLQTCLNQDFDDYEVVVCDNNSSDQTKEVVKEFGSSRIVYHRSSESLSMRENWELAYRQSSGDYVMFIGDDDALSPFALSQLNAFLSEHDVQAMTWRCAVYAWPNVGRSDLANYLQIPVSARLKWYEGRDAIRDVMATRMPAHLLPNIYHGLAARPLLEKIRGKAGHIFGGYMVDTYSSFAIAYFAGRYAHLSAPITISGFSSESHSIALHFLRGNHANTQRYRQENARSGLKLHPAVPHLPTGWACIADSYLTAREELFSGDSAMNFDRKGFIETLLKKPPINTVSEWQMFIQEIRSTLGDDPILAQWFEARVLKLKPWVPPKETFRNPLDFIRGKDLRLEARKYGVNNVADAADLLGRVLSHRSQTFKSRVGNGLFGNWPDLIKAKRSLSHITAPH
jgi:glycosyltransferase involved in cell wall biosynthesis